MVLDPTKKAAVRRAIMQSSPDRIAGALFDLKSRQFARGRILGVTNRYTRNTIKKLDRDIRATPSRINETSLSQYIAASTVLHNFDGWGFLSRSLEALINGDKYSAVHLAYYSQLRAVMSIFANEGLGVFSSRHVWFAKNGAVDHIRRVGTHDLANEGFKKWTRLKKKSNRILNVIGVEGVTLKEWIGVAMQGPGAIAMSQVTEDWLRSWGMDLRTLGKDHKLRNLASYRPQNIPPQPPLQIRASIESLSAIWSLLKPSTYGGFEVMDRYLLRNAIERTFRLTRNAAPTGEIYDAFVERTVDNLPRTLSVQSSVFLKQFLTRQLLPQEPHLFQQARQQGLIGDSELVPLPVIARAVMLLRLATAVTSELLNAKTVRSSDLDFWWELQGRNCGLWGSGGLAGAQIADLWEDIEIVLTDVSAWLNANPLSTDALDVRRSLSTELWELSKFQLAGLWGIWRV